jgi:anti-sigma-K factor RskA
MNCDDAQELLAAHALGALPEGEAAELRAHLASCDRHAEDARELGRVAASLPALADPAPPPPALRARLLDAVAAEATTGAGGTRAPASISSARVRRAAQAPARLTRIPPVWGALAAVLVLAVAGLLAWNIALQAGGDNDAQRFAEAGPSVTRLDPRGAPGAGYVVHFPEDDSAVLVAEGFRPLEGQSYQMWRLTDGEPASLGLMQVHDDGTGTAVFAYDADVDDTFAITIEPAGGSALPTSSPIFTAEI